MEEIIIWGVLVLCCGGCLVAGCFVFLRAQQRTHPHMAAGVVAGTAVMVAPPVYPPANQLMPAYPGMTQLPPGWTAAVDAQGSTYYYNSTTQATQWEHPDSVPAVPHTTMPVAEPYRSPLPAGWTTAQDAN